MNTWNVFSSQDTSITGIIRELVKRALPEHDSLLGLHYWATTREDSDY